MHINRFWRIFLIIALFIPSIILILKQLLIVNNDNNAVWDYSGAIGWSISLLLFFTWINNKSKHLNFTDMNKWTKKVSPTFLNRHYSNVNERIIPIKRGVPMEVAPKGMFLVGLFRDYDELAFVDLRPKHIAITFGQNDQIITADGVKIIGTIEIITKVVENDNLLIRLISNEEDEEKILYSHLKKSIRKIISDKNWIDITIFKEDKYENIKQHLMLDMKEVNCCFSVDEVMSIILAPIDNEFANLLEQKIKEQEQAKFQYERQKAHQQRIKLEHETEKIILEHERIKENEETEHRIKVTSLKSEAEINITNNEHEAELKRKKKENEAKMEVMREQAKLIKENIEILALINPEAYQQYKKVQIEEIIAKMKQGDKSVELLKQLVMKGMDAEHSEIKGMIKITQPLVAALASDKLNVDVKFPDGTFKVEKSNNSEVTGEDAKIEGEKSDEENNDETSNEKKDSKT